MLDALGTKGKVDLHAARLHALTQSADEQVAIKALTVVLAYRCGKPAEHVAITGGDGGPVQIHHHFSA